LGIFAKIEGDILVATLYYADGNFQEPSSRQMRLWQKRLGLEEDDLREEL
jgi:hypothetical protein